jgi:hypothetical protein
MRLAVDRRPPLLQHEGWTYMGRGSTGYMIDDRTKVYVIDQPPEIVFWHDQKIDEKHSTPNMVCVRMKSLGAACAAALTLTAGIRA